MPKHNKPLSGGNNWNRQPDKIKHNKKRNNNPWSQNYGQEEESSVYGNNIPSYKYTQPQLLSPEELLAPIDENGQKLANFASRVNVNVWKKNPIPSEISKSSHLITKECDCECCEENKSENQTQELYTTQKIISSPSLIGEENNIEDQILLKTQEHGKVGLSFNNKMPIWKEKNALSNGLNINQNIEEGSLFEEDCFISLNQWSVIEFDREVIGMIEGMYSLLIEVTKGQWSWDKGTGGTDFCTIDVFYTETVVINNTTGKNMNIVDGQEKRIISGYRNITYGNSTQKTTTIFNSKTMAIPPCLKRSDEYNKIIKSYLAFWSPNANYTTFWNERKDAEQTKSPLHFIRDNGNKYKNDLISGPIKAFILEGLKFLVEVRFKTKIGWLLSFVIDLFASLGITYLEPALSKFQGFTTTLADNYSSFLFNRNSLVYRSNFKLKKCVFPNKRGYGVTSETYELITKESQSQNLQILQQPTQILPNINVEKKLFYIENELSSINIVNDPFIQKDYLYIRIPKSIILMSYNCKNIKYNSLSDFLAKI